jgi:uroporphyrin-III C-methyltransferase / precorrin-2 dehydrogenase / sirohydrochlorin ferrochelatase
MHSLPIFVKLQDKPVILLGSGESSAAKRILLERAGAKIVGEEAHAAIAIVALDDTIEAESAVERLKARGILVNAVDRPALCDFTLPAIVDRDPVLIAIGTGGASAGLAKALRQRLELILPQALGVLAARLAGARAAMRVRWPDPQERRRAIDSAMAAGGLLDPFMATGSNLVDDWMDGDVEAEAPRLHSFTIESPDPDQLTIEVARLLSGADHIIHDESISAAILARGRADASRRIGDMEDARALSGSVLFLSGKKAK